MSNKYSLGGYRIALLARSSRTLLVEGKDDKELVDCLRLSEWSNRNITVDTQEIIDDPVLSGLGAKARIDLFLSSIPQASGLRAKILGFVDREWEELVDSHTLDPLPWSMPLQSDIRVKTLGHSIENYGFSPDFVERYLRHFGKSVATEEVITAVRTAVPELLRAGAAFSEAARKRQLLNRCTNVVEFADVTWAASRLQIAPAVEQRLASRGAQYASGLISDYIQFYQGKWATPPFSAEADLHAHGHVGEMILWVGVARIVADLGFSEATALEIATGRRDERRRVWHSWLTTRPVHELAPLDQALS